jgi:hypothetical protein
MVDQPYTVSPLDGSISIHGREGLDMELSFQLGDGTDRNVSAASMFFEVDGVLRVALTNGSSSSKKVVTLTRTQVASLAGAPRRFALIDETSTPQVLWSGPISLRGYTEQPA